MNEDEGTNRGEGGRRKETIVTVDLKVRRKERERTVQLIQFDSMVVVEEENQSEWDESLSLGGGKKVEEWKGERSEVNERHLSKSNREGRPRRRRRHSQADRVDERLDIAKKILAIDMIDFKKEETKNGALKCSVRPQGFSSSNCKSVAQSFISNRKDSK